MNDIQKFRELMDRSAALVESQSRRSLSEQVSLNPLDWFRKKAETAQAKREADKADPAFMDRVRGAPTLGISPKGAKAAAAPAKKKMSRKERLAQLKADQEAERENLGLKPGEMKATSSKTGITYMSLPKAMKLLSGGPKDRLGRMAYLTSKKDAKALVQAVEAARKPEMSNSGKPTRNKLPLTAKEASAVTKSYLLALKKKYPSKPNLISDAGKRVMNQARFLKAKTVVIQFVSSFVSPKERAKVREDLTHYVVTAPQFEWSLLQDLNMLGEDVTEAFFEQVDESKEDMQHWIENYETLAEEELESYETTVLSESLGWSPLWSNDDVALEKSPFDSLMADTAFGNEMTLQSFRQLDEMLEQRSRFLNGEDFLMEEEETLTVDPVALGSELQHWHSGEQSPTYQVGAMLYSGKKPWRRLVLDAIQELTEMMMSPKYQEDEGRLRSLIKKLRTACL